MNDRHTALNIVMVLTLGIGLAVAVLSLLGGSLVSVVAAHPMALPRAESGDLAKVPQLAAGSIITVCPGGGCDYSVIQDAVDAAQDGDEIRVATGTYTDVNDRGGLAQVVYLDKSLSLRGGYTVTDWVTSEPGANPTTLDARGQGRVLYIAAGISPTVENLRITGGHATGLGGGPSGEHVGGGVYGHASVITLSGCHVISNTAQWGGGIYLVAAKSVLVGNGVVNNAALTHDSVTPRGGGVYLRGGEAVLTDNTFSANGAQWGGGLYVREGTVSLASNRFLANTAEDGGGGVCTTRGAVHLVDNVVDGNAAELGGGAYLWQSETTVVASTFSNNVADWGGGLYQAEGTLAFGGSAVISNTANRGAGGMCVERAVADLFESRFLANNALGSKGGGLYLWSRAKAAFTNTVVADNYAAGSGSGMYLWGSSARLVHTTLARNGATNATGTTLGHSVSDEAGPGSEIRSGSVDSIGLDLRNAAVAVTNVILVGHGVGIYVDADSAGSFQGTLWGSGSWANDSDWAGPGEIDRADDHWGDPAFVDPDGGDYHVGASSAAIDRGVDAAVYRDIDGDPRPLRGGFDLGADEYAEIDLSRSRKTVYPDQAIAEDVLTYTILLLNQGDVSSHDTQLVDPLPGQTTYISGSAVSSAGELTDSDSIRWTGTLTPHEPVTITFSVTLTQTSVVRNTAVVTDQHGGVTRLSTLVNGLRCYFPLIFR